LLGRVCRLSMTLCEAAVMKAVSRRGGEARCSRACAICANDLAGPKRVGRPQRKEVAYVDAMLSPL